jgi:hypothetical protein
MGSYSAVLGILLFTTLLIFVGSILGVIAFDNLSENSNIWALPISVESQYILESDKSEDILDTVINAKSGFLEDSVDQTVYNPKHHYVEMGEIKFVEDSFVDDLPICMSIEYGLEQWVIIGVKGGYIPTLKDYYGHSAFGLMHLRNPDGTLVYNDCHPGMFVGWLLDSYTEIICPDDPDCCWTYYNFTLNPELCMNWVCLDSSYDLDGQFHEEKYYTIDYDTHWKGCEFDYILIHVYVYPKSQTPDKIHRLF